jgi:predicted nucleotidyltransferase
MSHPEIIDNCKRITVEHLIEAIGRGNIVSIILYGSVARNEESYKYVNGKPYLESDLDVLVVVKNKVIVVKSWILLNGLCKNISGELRKRWLLSRVNLSITTEDRLLNEYPDDFHLHLKLSGKVIFGKELIGLMRSYEYDQYKEIPITQLNRTIFGHMILLVRSIAASVIMQKNITADGYDSVLKSIRKLTLFMIQVIIIKDSIPLNPLDLTEIKTKKRLYDTNNSALFDNLLDSYKDIKLRESKEDWTIFDIQECLVRVISQFNSTVASLTGINYPLINLPKKKIFGHFRFIGRLEYIMFILLTNVTTTWTIGLFKYMIIIMLNPEQIYLRFYDLFVTSPRLMKPNGEVNNDNYQQRQSWLKLYGKSLKPWKYDITSG